ncbi:MAG: DNA mismatch repair endonuclease MutL [Candidatus Wallbacteria bacterium]|nr:DNA mismatch repair endonuclease MutL [Candidatus Wallbacteria bacterium]
MTEIRILDDHLVNKIAAGEVVARPASVVKELLENALDAGSRRIEIEFENGGISLLRVVDDGLGMTQEEALLALQRHATSKIATEKDLEDIRTFGFRGEALPSIAAVSRLEIRTRPSSAQGGTRIAIAGGKVQEARPVGTTVGTTLIVRDLFFNTPARLKFLRSESTETRHIIETVTEAILGHPEVSFKLSIPGRAPVLSSPGTGKLFDAMVSVFGPATARAMLPLGPRQHPELPYEVHGYVSRPDVSRATRNAFHLFVNGRPVQLPQMARAVADSYHAYLPRGRWPVAVLFVKVAAWAVDVNVHPQKLEVRLHQPERLAGLLGAAVKDSLAGERRPETVESDALAAGSAESAGLAAEGSGSPRSWSPFRSRPVLPYLPPPSTAQSFAPQAPATPASHPTPGSPFDSPDPDPASERPGTGTEGRLLPELAFSRGLPAEGAAWDQMFVLGQVFRTFVVGVAGDRLYFIDQHTAHERVLYEENVEKMQRRALERQPLLIPVTIECPRRSEAELEDAAALLSSCGFECDVYSGGTLVVKAIPVLERGIDVRAVMQELLEEAIDPAPLEERKEKVARMVSCKAAVKSGDSLSEPEMKALVRDLAKTQNPLRCPHGRPVLLQFSQEELKKLFERNW